MRDEEWSLLVSEPRAGYSVRRDGTPQDIEERTLEYALRVVHLFRFLEKQPTRAAHVIGKQFLRSGTSVGANVAEARAAESTRDFIHKLSIAQKEARESLYWLRLLRKADLVPVQRIEPLLKETDELVAIITAIGRSAKKKKS